MATNELNFLAVIVPVLLLDGSSQYPSVSPQTTARDLIESLMQLDEVKRTVLDVVPPSSWVLQRVRKEKPGRLWDERELQSLGDAILKPTSLIAPFLSKTNTDPVDTSPKEFSAFPLTARPHPPVLRLVVRHPLHSLSLTFLRVPEISDGFEWTVFFGKDATVEDVTTNVVQELGLFKVIPSSRGGGRVEYVLEVLSGSQATQLPGTTLMIDILRSSERPLALRFCIPDQWFRRRPPPSTRSCSSADATSYLETGGFADEEGEDTAKRNKSGAKSSTQLTTAPVLGSPEWRNSDAQSRLTGLLGSWSQPAPAATSAIVATPASNRKSVSEPLLIPQNTGGVLSMGESGDSSDFDTEELERCLDLLGLKGDSRENIHLLPAEKKRQVVEQVRIQVGKSGLAGAGSPATFTAHSPSGGSGLFPWLVPQLSGGSGFFKRLSTFSAWGSAASPPPASVGSKSHPNGDFMTGPRLSVSSEQIIEDAQPVQSQTTGSVFSTWWTASGGEVTKDDEHLSVRAYVDVIRRSRNADSKLTKHLVSLRVRLSTAKLPWIETFIAEEGIIAISGLLSSLVGKNGKRKTLGESENSVLLEVIRSLRVILNTEPGFDAVLSSPTIVTHITYSLYGTSLKTRTLSAEILAAICMVSFEDGYRAVLAALSEYRIAYNELFRFHSLVTTLKIPDSVESPISDVTEEEGVWEARTAFMTLINALTNCPYSLEERIVLRDEFSRRGLSEVIAALRYIKPPDSLLKQLDRYTEEKYEDEEDFRERARKAVRDSRRQSIEASEPSILFDEVMQAVLLLDARGTLEGILRKLDLVFQGPADPSFKTGMLSIMDEFVGGIAGMKDSEQAWTAFLRTLVASVERLSGRKLSVGNTKTLERQVQELHAQVGKLTREKTPQTSGGCHRRQEGSVIYIGNDSSLVPTPPPTPSPKSKGNPNPRAGNEIISSLTQKLAQKEKEVVRLRGEMDRLKAQSSSDPYDPDERARKERDRAKLNALNEEIATLEEKINEMTNTLSNKDKEIICVKSALESVYSCLQPKRDERIDGLDVRLIVSQCLNKLSEREAEVVALRAEVQVLKQSLIGWSKEQVFKANNPPPLPPGRRKATLNGKGNNTEPPVAMETVQASEIPPPPPPPPPQSIFKSDTPPPPPPVAGDDVPPPPPPPLAGKILSPPPSPGFAMPTRVKPRHSGPRLKPFFWSKLDNNAIGSTIWSEPSLVTDLKMDDLEATFMIDVAPPTASRVANSTGRQNVTTLLETTRANNMEIMLSRFKIGYPAIRQALLDLDDSTLSIDNLKAISKHLPTTEEVTRIKDFGDVTKLAKADRFIHEIMSIPRLSQRLECMIFRQKFELDVEEICPDLKTLRDACHELRTSQLFKRMLQTILAVGNRLNGSSFRGGARGFRLEALLKMKETKTAKATPDCPTLLHYIARVLLRTEPKLTLFIDELPNLEPAARISFQTVSQSVQSAIASRTKVEAEIQLMKQSRNLPADDRFLNVMQEFITRVSGSVEALKELTTSVERDLRSLFSYYGESFDSSDSLKPEDLFGMVCSFSLSLQKAAIDIAPSTPTLSPPSDDKHEAIKDTKPTPDDLLAPPPRQERQRSVGRGDLDEALRTLKDGQTRRQRNTASVRVSVHKVFVDGRQDGRAESQAAPP